MELFQALDGRGEFGGLFSELVEHWIRDYHVNRRSEVRVDEEDLLDDFPNFWRDIGGNVVLSSLDQQGNHIYSVSPERSVAVEEFIEKNAQGPNVSHFGLSLLLEYFRSHVLDGSAESLSVF